MIPVVLSGGSGTRLWPLSRELYPKQFLSLRKHHLREEQLGVIVSGTTELANGEERLLLREDQSTCIPLDISAACPKSEEQDMRPKVREYRHLKSARHTA